MSRKPIRRIVGIFLCIMLTASLTVGCGDESGSDGGKLKIGVSIWSTTSSLGKQCKEILDHTAHILGDVELEYIEQGHVSGKVTASVQTLINDGCKGIIICNSADSEMTSVIRSCNEAGVYVAQFFRVINELESGDIYQLGTDSRYYIGAVHENEVENGEKLGNILLEKGCRRLGIVGWEQGDSTWLRRWEGYKNAVQQWNAAHGDDEAILFDPQYAGTTIEGGEKAAETFMSLYPDLDALIAAGGGGDPFEGVLNAVEKAGKIKDIKVVSTDFRDDLETRLEQGSIAAESGGHYCDPLFAFFMVYNAVKGDTDYIEGNFNEINFPYLYVFSPQTYADYEELFVKQFPYSDDEIKNMTNASFDQLKEMAEKLSIEDAKKRLGR